MSCTWLTPALVPLSLSAIHMAHQSFDKVIQLVLTAVIFHISNSIYWCKIAMWCYLLPCLSMMTVGVAGQLCLQKNNKYIRLLNL